MQEKQSDPRYFVYLERALVNIKKQICYDQRKEILNPKPK